jgi:hypothetical protein
MKRLLGSRGVAAAFVFLSAIAIAGIAYASIPDANGVIHGCYRKTTGNLIVIDSGGKGCEEGWKPVDWNQAGPTGPSGPTGPTGTTGATGPTGPPGALTSAYMYAFTPAPQFLMAGNAVLFTAVDTALGIGRTVSPSGTTFELLSCGIYQVTLDLQDTATVTIQLRVNGVDVGPPMPWNCGSSTCTFTRLLSLNAGDTFRFVNTGGSPSAVGSAGATIVRVA